ncbi:MAG: SDR family oxidoreductase [Proteobacteria bacterium]|nr:SDR family oxidoreductase [Pseudomonadota bacterium]
MSKSNSLGTALITGAAKRIGSKMALFLANMGYDIVIHYHKSKEQAQLLQKQIHNHSPANCYIIQADLTDQTQVQNLAKELCDKYKNWNLLINNASHFSKSSLVDINIEQFNQSLNLHLKAPLILCQSFAQNCQKHNISGNIINMVDKGIVRNQTKYLAYLLHKKSLADFTKMSAAQLAPLIRVNGIAPGFIEASENNKEAEWEMNNLIAKTPLQKQGSAQHINKAVEYILANDYVTGQILFVDGGSSLKDL